MRVMRSRERERGSDREGESDHGAGATIIHISCAAEEAVAADVDLFRERSRKRFCCRSTRRRERASGGCSFSLPRFSLSFVCVAVRTFTSPRRHAHIADDRARKITWRCHRLGRSPPESAYRCRHHMGNVAHWKRPLQLQLYLRSNIIRLSRRST